MALVIKKGFSYLVRLPAQLADGIIAVYQLLFSPLKFALFGPGASCRFYPTCSCYARESLRRYGLAGGVILTLCRLLKCHPLHSGGLDPVPERFPWFLRISRTAAGRNPGGACCASNRPGSNVRRGRIREKGSRGRVTTF